MQREVAEELEKIRRISAENPHGVVAVFTGSAFVAIVLFKACVWIAS